MNNVLSYSDAEPSYQAMSGRVYASSGLAKRLKKMQWQTTIIYNATVDAKCDFSASIEHSITFSEARAQSLPTPERSKPSECFRPLGQENELIKALQPLCKKYPQLQGPPVSVYENTLAQAERARVKLVKDIVALPSGSAKPRMKFRSMRDDVSITTDNWRLYERRGPEWKKPNGPSIRSDSPKATHGKKKIKLEVKGLGRFNANLSRPIPDDGTLKQIIITMEANSRKIGVQLIIERTIASMRSEIKKRAWHYHEILRQMPDQLSAQKQIAWARGKGLRIRGDDLGIDNPSADDEGRSSARVTMTRNERVRVRDSQRALSRLDEITLHALPKAEQETVRAGKQRAPKRSRNASRIKRDIALVRKKIARRAKTAGYQDARHLTRDVDLIATDSPEMAGALIKKGGPAERRAKAGKTKNDAPKPKAPSDWMMSSAQQRTMRHNMATTSGAFRLRRVGVLARQLGILHIMPGHAGTSSECPGCDASKNNTLNKRRHVCECGVNIPRDQASAQVTLGRALEQFKVSNDPGGIRAAAWAKEDSARQRREKRTAGARNAALQRREKAGRSGPAMHAPINSAATRTSVGIFGLQTEALPKLNLLMAKPALHTPQIRPARLRLQAPRQADRSDQSN